MLSSTNYVQTATETADMIEHKPSPGQHYMPALTGIRAIAAYMVCFFHYNPFVAFRDGKGIKHMAFCIINEMHIGVSIFFVLSGFLICYRYYNSTADITKRWFGTYMMNRFARIYPLFIICTLFTFIIVRLNPSLYHYLPTGIKSNQSMGDYLSILFLNVTLLKAFFSEFVFTGITQAWSLTVEECFYLSAPFAMLYIRRSHWALLVLPVVSLLFMTALVVVFRPLGFHGLFGDFKFMLNYTFFGRCIEFFAGMGLAVFIIKNRRDNPDLLMRRNGFITLLGLSLITICLLGMAMISGEDNSKENYSGIAINNTALALSIVVLFFGLLTEKTWLRSLLSTKLFDTLGKSSYAFYLIHMGVLNVLLKTYLVHSGMIQFIILNIISVLLYKFVESPLHKWLKPQVKVATT
jgi:peptidoglycan/LPS O-acetylase OafA/YrhL